MPTFHPDRSSVQPAEGQIQIPAQADAFTAASAVPIAQQPNPTRIAVVSRLTVMCRRHARHVDERRRSTLPVGPHAVMFLFAEPGSGLERVKSATRMFYDLEEAQDLPKMLRQLEGLARQYDEQVGFDPRRHMTNRADAMTDRAHYIGVAVSTVYDSVPAQLVRRVPPRSFVENTPGADLFVRGVVVLGDGTRCVLYNRGFSEPYVESNHTLDYGISSSHVWRWSMPGATNAEPGLADVQAGLSGLHSATVTAMTYPGTRGRAGSPDRGSRRAQHRWIGEEDDQAERRLRAE